MQYHKLKDLKSIKVQSVEKDKEEKGEEKQPQLVTTELKRTVNWG